MKESPARYINPFLSDEENDKLNFTTNLDNGKFEKLLEPSSVPPESLLKAKEVYIDKNVTECLLPETGFNVVKDICVDEGLSHGEIIKCDQQHHELSCSPISGDKHDHMTDHMVDDMIKDDHDKIKLFVESNIVDSSQNFGPDKSVPNDEEKLDSGSNLLNNCIRVLEPVNNGGDDVDQQLSEAEDAGSEANEPRQIDHAIDTPSEIMMEENTSTDYDMVKPTTASGPLELPLTNHNDMASSNITMAARGGGESSFSMAGSVSGHITYLGPVTAIGSISHRSDGSNSSVRSFAFPILQNEWNSSPVRMAKADRKQPRKHRGWRQAVLCCRF